MLKAIPENRNSTSSDETAVNTSDELVAVEFENLKVISPKIVGARTRPETERQGGKMTLSQSTSRSRQVNDYHRYQYARDVTGRGGAIPAYTFQTPDQRAQEKIRDAENNKATLFPVAGNEYTYSN